MGRAQQVRAQEPRAAGDLVAHGVSGTVAIVGTMHGMIIRQVERSLPRPVRRVTRARAAAGYLTVDQVATATVRVGAEVGAEVAARRPGRELSHTGFGRAVLPVVHGVGGRPGQARLGPRRPDGGARGRT